MLSAKVPYFILDILQQVPSIDVKGLGRFDAIFQPAVIDAALSQVKPPFIQPGFGEEGGSTRDLLAAYMNYVSGVEVEKAKEAIEQFVQEVKDHTEGNESYAIQKFGTFSKSSSGNIRFTPDWDAFNLSFSGLEVLDLKTHVEVATDASIGLPPPLVPALNAEKILPVAQPVEAEKISVKEPIPIFQPSRQEDKIRDLEGIDQSTSKLWWMILSSALALIAVLCAYLAWDILSNRSKLNELKRIYPDSTFQQPHEKNVPADTQQIIVENIPVDEVTAPKDSTNGEVGGKDQSTPCFIVVGAFRDPSNVTKMEDRLKSMGYTFEQIKGKTLTRVAIRTSCDPANMERILNEARSSINPEAWIY